MDFSNDTNTILGVNAITLASDALAFSGTGAIVLPAGTTSQRPATPVTGSVRFNTTTALVEIYTGGVWTTTSSTPSAVTTQTSDYTLTASDYFVLVNGGYTMTLPAASSSQVGTRYKIKQIGTANVTIATLGGLIDGNISIQLQNQYTSVDLVSDGSNWWIT